MKRLTAWILLICICLALTGCHTQERIKSPVSFYYRRLELTYDGPSSVITAEQRESDGHIDDIQYLLGEYLKGPLSPTLSRTFPNDTSLISYSMDGTTAQIVLSDPFAVQTGMDLTISCACINMTVMALTGAESVCIRAETALLDNMPSITMDENALLLFDSSADIG